jgi:RimJ/RimL family protein N-acetyltransferase
VIRMRKPFPSALVTARLQLRRPQSDERDRCADLISQAYATRVRPLTEAQATAFGVFALEHWERFGFGFMLIDVVALPAAVRTVGHAGFKCMDAWPNVWSGACDAIEVGYAIVPAARGNGYATDALRCLLETGSDVFEVPSVSARCDADNPKSAAVLVRCGMIETPSPDADRRFVIHRNDGLDARR